MFIIPWLNLCGCPDGKNGSSKHGNCECNPEHESPLLEGGLKKQEDSTFIRIISQRVKMRKLIAYSVFQLTSGVIMPMKVGTMIPAIAAAPLVSAINGPE